MPEGFNINVESPTVQAPISVDLSGVSIIDSVKNGMSEFISNVKSGSDEALTAVFLSVMFFTVGLFFWRKV
jgi:hypothetical protein